MCSTLLVMAMSSLAAACGSDANSVSPLSSVSTGPTVTTVPTPVGSAAIEPLPVPSPSIAPPVTTVPAPVGSAAIELPAATVDSPGDVAVWTLESASDVLGSSSAFTALVTRLGCSGGVTGEVLEPTVEIGETEIVVTFFVAALDSDLEQTCPGNDEVPYVVVLVEPIGDRPILDGSCRDGSRAASTSFCAAGAARWVP